MKSVNINLDMDGVLVDFLGGARDLFGFSVEHLNKSFDKLSVLQKAEKRKLWIEVRQNPIFWERLNPLEDAMDLWNGVKHLNPIILTAAPSVFGENSPAFLEVCNGKKNWIKNHLKIETENRFLCTLSKKKHLFINPQIKFNVLIDDRADNIKRWNDAGGIGILHTSAITSLEFLREILRNDL